MLKSNCNQTWIKDEKEVPLSMLLRSKLCRVFVSYHDIGVHARFIFGSPLKR